jgi:4-diphosphocytidyl-2-C-methyl-D-erythritol kinase
MSSEVTLLAPAKVNLHLDVRELRPDGYHEIVSLFQAVSLADILSFRVAGAAGALRIEGDFGFPPEQNIITRAVRLFRARTGIDEGVEALVEKRIPMAAGLGGGSSDAAAALRCLASLFPSVEVEGLLPGMAAELGSDVPFFLGSPAAVVEGRGERLRPVPPRLDFTLIAVMPGISIATAEAYRALDATRPVPPAPRLSAAGLEAMYVRTPVAEWDFSNSFDEAIFEAHPRIRAARDALADGGARSPRLTGSGSAVIGVFPEPQEAWTCMARLLVAGHSVVMLRPLAAIPDVCYNSRMRIRQWEDTHGDYGHSHQEGRI